MIRLPLAFWVLLIALLFVAKLTWAEPYKQGVGPHRVETILMSFQDEQRDRAVPVKVYVPMVDGGAFPVVLVSHGLGGSRDGLAYLGNHLASHGYMTVHMQHLGSDASVWKGLPAKDILPAMRKAANTPRVAIDRAGDVPFVLDRLEQLNQDEHSKLAGKIDADRIAIAGHSFGAWSAMAAGNMTVGGQHGKSFGDPRIRCIIPLSPPVAQPRQRAATYATLNVPALFMTGTLDTSRINHTTAEDRLIPYQLMPGPADNGSPKYLVNFNGADHMTFSGETKRSLRSKVSKEDNRAFHTIILQTTTAFLDCYLLDDKDAQTWLHHGGFVALVDDRGEVRMETTAKE
jgi:predicted dienelactone hydrolase